MSRHYPSAETIFAQAIDIESAEERAAFVHQASANDPELCSEVEKLVADHFRAGGFLQKPAAYIADTIAEPPRESPGTAIGSYQLLEQIGEGAFGIVFLAEQTQPVRRQVAIKILKPGMDTRQVVARFEAERQALAIMDHPNIARVFDGGTTKKPKLKEARAKQIQKPKPDTPSQEVSDTAASDLDFVCDSDLGSLDFSEGRPYFVMELVKGVPITDYCDQHRLTPRQRLELFIPVCHAVQHAHQKGIIHRDLKPSNVLVALCDGKPVPKVIDFGVAKAIGQPLTEKSFHTGKGALVGTLEYMSPEQATLNQLDVDTRSDIYSLGVLLYELLTGTTPLEQKRVKEKGLLEALRIIREEETPCPSARLSTVEELPSIAAQRQMEPAKLRKLVRGELDWIVMKALEKDRNRRYETANALAQDVQRYLQDEPVQACPPSAIYRVRKFVRRNKRVLATAALAGVMLLLGLAVSAGSIGWAIRNRSAQQAEIVREADVILENAALLRRQGKWAEARTAGRQVERLAEQGASIELQQRVRQFFVDLEMAERLEEVGLWRLGGHPDVATWPDAHRAYVAAFRDYGIDLAVLELQTAAERIQASAISQELLAALDDWDWQHEQVAAEMLSTKLFASLPGMAHLRQRIKNAFPTTDDVPPATLRVVAGLADTDAWRLRLRPLGGKLIDGERHHNRPQVEELANQPEGATLSPASAILLSRVFVKVGAKDKARDVLFSAHQRNPSDFSLNHELTQHLFGRGPEQTEKRAGFIRAALAVRPASPGLHLSLGEHLLATGNLDQAIAEFRTTIALRPTHVVAYLTLGRALAKNGDWDGAIVAQTRAIELNADAFPGCYVERARAYAELGLWEKAAADYERIAWIERWESERHVEHAAVLVLSSRHDLHRQLSVRLLNYVSPDNRLAKLGGRPPNPLSGSWLAARCCTLGPMGIDDPAQAVKRAELAIAAKPDSGLYRHTLGMAHYRAGDFERAIRQFRASMDAKSAWSANVLNWLGLALAYHLSGQSGEARSWLDRATKWIETARRNAPKGSVVGLTGLELHDSLACHVLRREAEALLVEGNAVAPADAGTMEAENLPVADSRLCKVTLQDMSVFGQRMWSGGWQLLCEAKKGGYVELPAEVTRAGRYRLTIHLTKSWDFGIVEVSLNGNKIGERFDGYDAAVVPPTVLSFGIVELQPGQHRLRFTAVAKRAKSIDYRIGIDCLKMELVK